MDKISLLKSLRLAHIYSLLEDPKTDPKLSAYVYECLQYEHDQRQKYKAQKLIRGAGFLEEKSIENYEWKGQVEFPRSINRQELCLLSFVDRKENVVMIGPPGTGKTHLAVSIGREACLKGRSVRFYRVLDLVYKLEEAYEHGNLDRLRKQLLANELIILDELGYLPISQNGSKLLFQIISDLYEKHSILITTNLEFSRWNSVFSDPNLTTALVDRLYHHAHVLYFSGESYRVGHALSQQ